MLRYTDLDAPGITRKRIGRAWGYFDAKGKRITDRDEIDSGAKDPGGGSRRRSQHRIRPGGVPCL